MPYVKVIDLVSDDMGAAPREVIDLVSDESDTESDTEEESDDNDDGPGPTMRALIAAFVAANELDHAAKRQRRR